MEENHKYTESGENDPLLRCKDCQKLVHMDYLHVYGSCPECGNLRFSDVTLIKEDEMSTIKDGSYDFHGDYEVDPEFLALFEPEGADEA